MGAPPTINLIGEIWAIISLANLATSFIWGFIVTSFFAVAYTLLIYATPNQGQTRPLSKFLEKVNFLFYMVFIGHAYFLVFGILMFI